MKHTFFLKGMHCVSCEILLKNNLKTIPGVRVHSVSHRSGKLTLSFEDASDLRAIESAIHKSGFELKTDTSGTTAPSSNSHTSIERLLQNIIILLIVLLLLIFTRLFDLGGRFIPNMDELRFGSAFLVGVVASLSTCLAVTGGIIIGYSKYIDSSRGISGHLKVAGSFWTGRLLAFFLGGGILGLTGQSLGVSAGLSATLSFIVGILLLYLGLQVIEILPNISKLGVALPSSLGEKITSLKHPKYAPLAGAATFFLPCGFTQTMQLLALSSGSFMLGGMIMLVFALGTMPVLFLLGVGVGSISEKKSYIFSRIIAGVLIFFGLTTLLNAKNLITFPTQTPVQNSEIISQNIEDLEYETIRMGHNGWSTVPETLTLEAGKNYKVIITPESNGLGCMSTQLIPKINSEVSYVQAGVPIEYDFIAPFAGKYNIVCASMGMKQGTIIFK